MYSINAVFSHLNPHYIPLVVWMNYSDLAATTLE